LTVLDRASAQNARMISASRCSMVIRWAYWVMMARAMRPPGDAAHDTAARGWGGDDANQLFERVNLGCGWGV
jgi:hypothetical protein